MQQSWSKLFVGTLRFEPEEIDLTLMGNVGLGGGDPETKILNT